jgi:precorrin-3B C17-methyltransferase
MLARDCAHVALVCGGDAGVYGLAGLAHELRATIAWDGHPPPEIEVVPGVTAATASAALLGAPLGHDFAVISLSDLLTPWEVVSRRLRAAAEAGFVLALYNPTSSRRGHRFRQALAILRACLPAETPAGIVTNAYRPNQSVVATTLAAVEAHPVNMLSIVIVGNSQTRMLNASMVTPRGYPQTPAATPAEPGPAPEGAERA